MEKVIVITVDGLSQENLDTVQKQLDLRLDELEELRKTQKELLQLQTKCKVSDAIADETVDTPIAPH